MPTSIFHAASYREWPYNYGGDAHHLGYEAFVVKHSANTVTVVCHRLKYIEVVEMTVGEFLDRFTPDVTLTPSQMARQFVSFLTFMQAPLEARELISAHTKINYPDKEFQMARSKPVAAKTVKTASKSKAQPQPSTTGVYADCHRRTCIKVGETADHVKFIPLGQDGFDIEEAGRDSFNQMYKEIPDYPLERAARLYVEYSQGLGGTKEALKALGQFTTVTDKEITMATTKRAARGATKTAAKPAAEKTAAAKKAATKTATKTVAAKTTKTAAKPTGRQAAAAAKKEKGVSAAQRFQDLIMAGKLTDDKIFETVQKEFGLDDNKRSYVRWYRNSLIKQGKNPPAAK